MSTAPDADVTLRSPSGEHALKTTEVAPVPGRSTVLPKVQWDGQQPKLEPTHRLRFEELGLLGQGGMGEVTLVKDHDIERTVALKRLPPNADLGAVLRFVEEIRTIGHLEHPNIMPVHDVGVDDQGRYFFVMKHLRGETLESIIERLKAGDPQAHQKYPFTVRIQLFQGVLNAMAYAHREGFLHRDLKPANIMVGPYGEVTVLDWGLARRHGAKEGPLSESARARTTFETQLGSVLGTPLYMCPEQARGAHDQLDVRSDLYSLGVVFHELLFLDHYLGGKASVADVLDGVKTVTPDLFAHVSKPIQGPVPSELCWFLSKALQKEPSQRYQSAEEMLADLDLIVRGEFHVQCLRTFGKRMLREAGPLLERHPALVIGGFGATVLLAVVGAVMAVLHVAH